MSKHSDSTPLEHETCGSEAEGKKDGTFHTSLTSELIQENRRAKEDTEKQVKVSKQKRKREKKRICVCMEG